ncbi:GntR family transcriptional regulator [Microbacterium testaceum]|uniref:GntR family transcriptional regulator n=1 Tax=Microbacterium testaceum TaxID=2033 RepID=A0A2T7WPX3_MICTE|nr:GntR family transcriptional regulator [Microbacterium testaceum]PVE76217.1 GntR family transcriptional regulator [Microbacterium testaceum]
MRDAAGEIDEKTAGVDLLRFFRGLIVSGRLGAGDRLPTVRQAAADFAVAPGTVQRAYKALEAEGLVHSRVGSGTRVADGVSPMTSEMTRQVDALVAAVSASGGDIEAVVDVLRMKWEERAPDSR